MTKKQLRGIADNLRANQTKTERAFADRLIRAQWLFEEQFIIGFYIVDFLIPASMQIIEIDGSVHFHNKKRPRDKKRAEWLADLGFRIKRIPADQVGTYPLRKLRAKNRKRTPAQFDAAMTLAEERSVEYFKRGDQQAFILRADQFARQHRDNLPRLIKTSRRLPSVPLERTMDQVLDADMEYNAHVYSEIDRLDEEFDAQVEQGKMLPRLIKRPSTG